MRTVLQRVDGARVLVAGKQVGGFEGPGLVALVGVAKDDGPPQAQWTARKLADLRILAGERSATEAQAPVLVVSQFTLHADVRKGRRPSWGAAAPGDVAEPLVDAVAQELGERGLAVHTGVFGADMRVELVNDGPVTLVIDTP